MMLNAADIVILAVLGLSLLFGLWRGLISEVLSLLCWVAAFWVAWALGERVAQVYQPWLHAPAAALIAGYVTCFVGVLVVGALIGWVLRKLLEHGGLRGGDRFLGALFGLARGVLLVTFVVLMLGFTALPREAAWWHGSMLLPTFETGAGWVAGALPPTVTRYLALGGKALPALSAIPISALRQAAARAVAPTGSARAKPAATATSGRATGHGLRGRDVGQ